MATESEQHINEMRQAQAETLSSIAGSTYRVGGLAVGGSVGIKLTMLAIKASNPAFEHIFNETPLETISSIMAYTGVALGTVGYILENASNKIKTRLPKNTLESMKWDKIMEKLRMEKLRSKN